MQIYTELGDDIGRANALLNLGVTAQEEGLWEEADRLWAESSDAFGRAGDVVGAAISSTNRGEVLSDLGRHDQVAGDPPGRAHDLPLGALHVCGVAYVTGLLGPPRGEVG